ncbi:hypothetical protein RHMOL_Rhmol04G0202100 [Rhododendron molle]|uniref:Uncharacterized protein n=1 Tax=Rhododendron molle TaxID=49168 RepID=A0ACC0P2D0_RHOML|nr:hypothetical protein RHMOL_Rhmol04G0202100 [Rhododendron molle]
MAQPVLDQWLNSFNGLDRLHFRSFGRDFIFSLRQVPVNFAFLRAATSLWDPAFHVFRFRREEFCPTIEEFAAIMGHSDREGLVIPNPLFNLLRDRLQVQKHDARFFMVNGRLETLQLVQRFGTAEAHRQIPQQKAYFHALCICLLHYYLLGPCSGHADSMLLDFAQQMGNYVGFAGLVLAETLIGLDMVKGNPTAQFSGNPLLLQVLLYEKLRVWDVPERLPYSLDHCMKLRVIRQFPTEAAGKHGWRLVRVIESNGCAPGMFGAEQVKVWGDPEYAISKVHDANLRRNVLRLWPNRVMQEVAENFADKLSGSYKCWLEKNLLEDKSAKRRRT